MKIQNSKKKLKEFGIIFGVAFPFLIGLIMPALAGHPFRFWTIWIGFLSIFLSIVSPKTLSYPYMVWNKLGTFLGLINSYLILSIVFFFVMQPTSLVMKIFRYDPLRKNKNNKSSYNEDAQNKTIDLTKIF